MTDVREMKVQGGKNIDTVAKQLAAGHQAQGFALAQTIKAITVSTAQQLARCVFTAFDYAIEARDECIRDLNAWKKELSNNAKDHANLTAGGMDVKQRGRIARSAATRVSEFTSVVKAMNNGMTRETLQEKCGVVDVENIGFHTIVEISRAFNQSGAAGVGRPADPFAVKLAKWLERQKELSDADEEVKARAINALADILPKPEGTPDGTTNHRRAEDQVPY